MSTTPAQVLEALQRTGFSWILQDESRDRILQVASREIDEFIAAHQDRFHVVPEPFELLNQNSEKAKAFFQAFLGPPYSVEARLLIWLLLSGFEISTAQFTYVKNESIFIKIETESPYGERRVFESDNPWDFRLFRHIGLLGYGDRVILDGFYAIRPS